MKQKLLLKTMLLLCALIAGTSSTWATDPVASVAPSNGKSYVVAAYVNSKYYALPNTATNGGTLSGTEISLNAINKVNTSVASGNTWTLEEGTDANAGKYYLKYTSGDNTYYLYKNGTSTSNKNFKVSTSYKNYWSFTSGTGGYTVAAVDRGTNLVNIQCNNGTFQCNSTATPIILLEIGDVPSTTPSITANDVDIAYNAEEGSIAYTLANGTGNVTASITSGDWLTLGTVTATEVPFTCEANTSATARTAQVTLKWTGATDKVVTITQAGDPNALNNISDITASGTAYKVKGTVVATNAKGFVTGDGTGYVYTYLNAAPTQAVNDKVKIVGTTGTYGQIIQFTSSATISAETTSNYDGTPAATVLDAAGIAAYNNTSVLKLSNYVQFEGTLAKNSSNYDITVGTATARISYPTTAQASALDALLNKTVRVKGYFSGFSSSTFTVMLESVEGVPVISASSASLAVPNYMVGTATPSFETLTVNGSYLTDNITLTLDANSSFEMSTDLSSWSNSVTLTQTSASVTNEEVAIRLKAGLAKGNYEGSVTLTSTGATNVVVSLSGSVTGQTYEIAQYTDPATAHGTITFTPASPVEDGTEVTLSAEPADGYEFTAGSWVFYKESGNDFVVDNSITVSENKITMPAYNLYVDGTFTAKTTYAVTCVADPVAGGTIGTTTATAYKGQTVTLNYTVENGYWLSDIVITKTSDGSATTIIPTKGTGSTYTFEMPDYAVTATAKFVEVYASGTFAKYTDDITEGYYVITSTDYAMKNTVSSSRFTNGSFTATNNMITNPSVDVVWYIKPNGSYWTIYNVDVAKFAAGTDTKNQGALIDDVTDLAKWTVTKDNTGTFQFENYGRSKASSDSGNKWLRNNTTNGWACYGTGTGNGNLTLYKLSDLVERTITFNGNGGTYNTATTYTQTVYDGVEATLDANKFTREGYEFMAWNAQADGQSTDSYNDGDKITVTGSDLTLYAQWAPLYTLTIDTNIDGGSVEVVGNLTSSVEGVDITLKATPSAGNKFTAWDVYKSGDPTTKVTVTNNVFNMPAYNVVISATFEAAQTYSLVTSVDQLVSGKFYIIASGTDGAVKAMGSQNSSHYRNVVDATAASGIIAEPTGVNEFVIFGPDVDGNYTIYDSNYSTNGGSLYASSSDKNYLDTQAANDANGTWSISIANTGAATINAQGSNSRNRMRFNGDRFACYASNTSVSALPYIYVKDNDNLPGAIMVTLANSGYASYCAPFPLDLTPTSDYAAYAVTATSGTTVTFSKINGAVPAGTPFILYGENYGGQNATLNVATGATTAVSDNMLKGTFVPTAITTTTGTGENQYTNFGLSGGSFKKLNAGTLPANKAYLPVLTANLPTSASEFTIVFDDVTGISRVENVQIIDENYYDLQGRKV